MMNEFGIEEPLFKEKESPSKAKSAFTSGVSPDKFTSGYFAPKFNLVDGQFSAGQDTFNVGTGFFLGTEDGNIKFSIGNSTTDLITWDGSNINVRSSIADNAKTVFTQHISGTAERLSTNITNNTTMHVGLSYTTHGILVNRITLRSGAAAVTPGTIKIAIFSEDGQTKYIEETSATISYIYTYQTITLSTPVYLPSGVYYTAILGQGSISASFMGWKSPLDDDTYTVTGGQVTSGYMTVAADTIPSTINPVTGITFAHNRSLVLRMDNI